MARSSTSTGVCNSGVELGDEDAEEDCEDADEGTVPDVEDEEADNDDELKNSTHRIRY